MTELTGPTLRRRWGHAPVRVLLAIMLSSLLTLWAWDAIAVELFGAPAIRFKHALAFQAAVATLAALLLSIARDIRDAAQPPARR